MKLTLPSMLVLCAALVLLAPARLCAQIDPKLQDSTVRILCPEPAEKGGKGFSVMALKLSNGDDAGWVGYSKGTGFVINNDGFIVTNNHVVAVDAEKDEQNPLILVMQKVGTHFILHRARVFWQSPNADLAVIQAPNLKAPPLPLEFNETKSTASEEVYSMGFPGITDIAEEDLARSEEIFKQMVPIRAGNIVAQLEHEKHRKLRRKEIEEIISEVAQEMRADPPPADWMDLLVALDRFLKSADGAAISWDVTDVIARKTLWGDYFKPTVTKGNIERIAKIHGFLGVSYPDVMVIQHSCAIKHGNSGGPLLNAGGQVIGVVGRGMSHEKEGEREDVTWATAIGELKVWIGNHPIPYIAAGEWRKPPETPQPIRIIERQPVKIIEQLPTQIIQQPTLKVVERLPLKMIIAISLAVVLAIIAAVICLLKFNQKPSVTKMLRDPRMARILGTTPSKLLDIDAGPPKRIGNGPLPGLGKWQLTGRAADGENVQIEMTDLLFTSNDYRLILGRAAELCHVVVNDRSVSKQHAHIRKDGNRFLVADRNSANHTAVNGQPNRNAFDEVPLKEGDTLTLGEVRLQFSKL